MARRPPTHPGRPRPVITGAFAAKLVDRYGLRLAVAFLLAATKKEKA